MSESPEKDQRHHERMERREVVIDGKIARAHDKHGMLLVHSSNGRDKNSSAFDMVTRALGHGMRVGVIQFIKDAANAGEKAFFRRFPEEVSYHVMDGGFTWETQNRQRDIAKAKTAWKVAAQLLADPDVDLVVLDELNIILKHGYLELDRVLADIQARPVTQHVVVTDRGIQPRMVEAVGTVTKMSLVRHMFKAGIKAQKGVEF